MAIEMEPMQWVVEWTPISYLTDLVVIAGSDPLPHSGRHCTSQGQIFACQTFSCQATATNIVKGILLKHLTITSHW